MLGLEAYLELRATERGVKVEEKTEVCCVCGGPCSRANQFASREPESIDDPGEELFICGICVDLK